MMQWTRLTGFRSSKHEIKRQRTGSDSPEPPSTLHTASQAAESDDDDDSGHPKSNKKARSAAAEALRQKEARERERMRDQKRAELIASSLVAAQAEVFPKYERTEFFMPAKA